MSAHKPLHLLRPNQRIRGFLRSSPRSRAWTSRLVMVRAWWWKFLDTCWNAYSCEQSGPSKQHRFSPKGVQPAIRAVP